MLDGPSRHRRADLHRLRRQGAPGRHDRRRPGSGADARDRPLAVLLRPGGGGDRAVSSQEQLRSILVAGVGNALAARRRLRRRGGSPAGERRAARRGFGDGRRHRRPRPRLRGDARLRRARDPRRQPSQGGEPGTLYVMEPDEESVEGGIEDGEAINPHGMDPQTVLRFVKSIGAWPGRVVVIACEPAEVEEMGWGSPSRSATRSSARSTWCSRRSPSCARAAAGGGVSAPCTSCRSRSAIVNTAVKHADGRRVTAVSLRVGRAAPGRPRLARVLLRVRRPRHGLRGRAARAGGDRRAAALRRLRARVGDRDPGVPLPDVRRRRGRDRQRQRVRGRVDRGRGRRPQCIAPR